ncbi:MAG: hypothetical protein KAV80_03160 [Methanomicrobia archaeon]|nr:hypothetical protein [Methanomicrobia archaeon]
MGKRNPIEDAHLLYVAFIIIAVLISTVLIVEVISNQREGSNLQAEKTLSDLEIEILSLNSFEISLKITNMGLPIVEKKDLSFYWGNEKINPKFDPKSCLRRGECLIVKIDNKEDELKIFYKDKLIYSHYFP